MAKGPIDKMQFKGGDALVLRAPEEFEAELSSLRERTPVKTTLRSKGPFPFALAFVTSCAEIEALAAKVADRVEEDGILWFAYPKKSSKRYDSDVGRDDSWGPLGEVGFEPVRQIAIDEDWSALRFRRVEHIKSFTRSDKMILSAAGKKRARKR